MQQRKSEIKIKWLCKKLTFKLNHTSMLSLNIIIFQFLHISEQ